jgi:CRP/FNR family transcriptional regulator
MIVTNYSNVLTPSIIPSDFYPVPALRQYIHMGNRRCYPKNNKVLLSGDELLSIGFVMSGVVIISRCNASGRRKYIYSAGPNSLIGKLFPLTHSRTEITATFDCEICFFSKEVLTDIFRQDEEIVFEIIKNYYTKVEYFMSQVEERDTFPARLRLLRLLQRFTASEESIVLSRSIIAEIIGVHEVTINKIVSSLVREGILKKSGKELIICDVPGLERIIEKEMNSDFSDEDNIK